MSSGEFEGQETIVSSEEIVLSFWPRAYSLEKISESEMEEGEMGESMGVRKAEAEVSHSIWRME